MRSWLLAGSLDLRTVLEGCCIWQDLLPVLHTLLADDGRIVGDLRCADRGETARHCGILALALADRGRRGVTSSVSDNAWGAGLCGCAEEGEKVLLRWECNTAAVLSRFCFTYCVGSKRGGLAGADAGREPQELERTREPVLARDTADAAWQMYWLLLFDQHLLLRFTDMDCGCGQNQLSKDPSHSHIGSGSFQYSTMDITASR